MSQENLRQNTLRICQFFKNQNIQDIIISPGYRNAPLSLAFSEDPFFKIITSIDERNSGFFALGIVKANKKPVVVLTTSGTALGNLYPAVMEASHSHLPLIILSADRPLKALDTGSNQTTNQSNFFTSFVNSFLELDLSKKYKNELEYHLAKNIYLATDELKPIHINLRIDEPYLGSQGLEKSYPIPKLQTGKKASITPIKEFLDQSKNPLFFAGMGHNLSQDVLHILEKKNLPILTENSSSLQGNRKNIIRFESDFFDQLKEGRFSPPDLCIFLGSAPIQTKIYEKIAKLNCKIVCISLEKSFIDPEFICSNLLDISIKDISLEEWESLSKSESEILNKYSMQQKNIYFESDLLSEPFFYQILSKYKSDGVYFLGNSMPIRDFNKYFFGSYTSIYANRGLSGIDGLLSTSAGIAYGLQRQIISIVGDLSFLHDLSSLCLMNRLQNINMKIFVLNNNGGEIFRIVKTKDFLDKSSLFTTPQKFSLDYIAKGFSIPYIRIEKQKELKEKIEQLNSSSNLEIIEVVIDKDLNLRDRNL